MTRLTNVIEIFFIYPEVLFYVCYMLVLNTSDVHVGAPVTLQVMLLQTWYGEVM
jgi:hypothetical protein